jgi:hypothetical protein
MIPLAVNVAILDDHTRFTCLETSTSLFAAFCTADDVDLVHPGRDVARLSLETSPPFGYIELYINTL